MRVLVIVVCIVIVALAALWGYGLIAQNRAASEPWPAGLGALKDVPRRFPAHGATPAAKELVRLAAPLGIDLRVPRPPLAKFDPLRGPLSRYLKTEVERADAAIAAPPEVVARYLAAHGEELAAVRRQLLSAAPVAFPVDLTQEKAPLPNLISHMQLFRLLGADALDRGRRGELVAWDDLEASWRLARSLFGRPEQISQLVALAGMRQANAIARKMPLPAPYWLSEMEHFDNRQSYLQAMQAETWTMWRSNDRFGVYGPFQTNLIGQRRWLVGQLAADRRCSFDRAAFATAARQHIPSWNRLGRLELPNLQASWERIFRARAELELTSRALAARSDAPPNAQSQCSDGQWLYETRPDGAVAIRFSGALPSAGGQDQRVMRYPAEFVVTPAPAKPRST
ncbi:MAG TPA: hypothetical protein VGR02_12510 [Thermoanaerobaculia bacterium]|jgi:hypothetical protein|nr:hypothetical protein [Thermoanaerobaculia bacterium]